MRYRGAKQCIGKKSVPKYLLYVNVPQFDMQFKKETIVYGLYVNECKEVTQDTLGSFDSTDPLPMLAREWIKKHEKMTDKDIRSMPLNAWDARSHIGNGGVPARDHTLDGWMVAGVRNFGRPFADMSNTSYLHNVAMLLPEQMPVV